jgi:hypothetical protein
MKHQFIILIFQLIIMFITNIMLLKHSKRDRETLDELRKINAEFFAEVKDMNKLPGDEWKDK